MRGNNVLADWVAAVRNHFWHCAKECKGDLSKMKVSAFPIFFFIYKYSKYVMYTVYFYNYIYLNSGYVQPALFSSL